MHGLIPISVIKSNNKVFIPTLETMMARPVSGGQHLERALQVIRTTKSADELRAAQAVALPLLLGLSIQDTAAAIGRAPGVACRIRTRYCKVAEQRQAPARSKRSLRNHAQLELQAEAQLLQDVFGEAASGGVLVIPQLLPEFERRLGKPVALSTIYRMLARHGWRKLAPVRHEAAAQSQVALLATLFA
jgi:hypothetical protein